MIKCKLCGSKSENEQKECFFCGELLVKTAPIQKVETNQATVIEKKELSPTAKNILASADFMDTGALVDVGKMFFGGVGHEKSYEASYQLFYKAAQKGSAEAMFYVAEHFAKGYGVETDVKNAIWWYIQSARAGNQQAQSVLAETFKSELPLQTDESVFGKNSRLKDSVLKARKFCVEILALTSKNNASQGSGCIISPDYVLTNYHVVVNSETKKLHKHITMKFHPSCGDKEPRLLKVVRYDPKEDIAVCQFDDGTKIEQERFPELVDAHSLEMGEEVFTIGNTVGQGLALSTGVVARELEHNVHGTSETIRVDMSVNSGNSGGALFDLDGNIRGLITFILIESGGKGKSYGACRAITSNTIKEKMFE